MRTLIAVVAIIITRTTLALDSLDLTASVYLDRPVSPESDVRSLFPKGGVFRTIELYCQGESNVCALWTYDIADEYCSGKETPTSRFAMGFNHNNYETIAVTRNGNAVTFDFDDLILYGNTHNSIKITFKPNELVAGGQAAVSKIEGVASAVSTTQGVPLQSKYMELKKPVSCNLVFFPPEK